MDLRNKYVRVVRIESKKERIERNTLQNAACYINIPD